MAFLFTVDKLHVCEQQKMALAVPLDFSVNLTNQNHEKGEKCLNFWYIISFYSGTVEKVEKLKEGTVTPT